MKITYDPAKNAKNIAERGLSFDRVEDFDWSTALMIEDACRRGACDQLPQGQRQRGEAV